MNELWTNRPNPKGIHFRSTPGHGYIEISAERLEQIPPVLLTPTRFYSAGCRSFEEDCEWARVAVAFPNLWPETERDVALEILKRYKPDIFAAWTAQGCPVCNVTA